jgi:hypothetical protein
MSFRFLARVRAVFVYKHFPGNWVECVLIGTAVWLAAIGIQVKCITSRLSAPGCLALVAFSIQRWSGPVVGHVGFSQSGGMSPPLRTARVSLAAQSLSPTDLMLYVTVCMNQEIEFKHLLAYRWLLLPCITMCLFCLSVMNNTTLRSITNLRLFFV